MNFEVWVHLITLLMNFAISPLCYFLGSLLKLQPVLGSCGTASLCCRQWPSGFLFDHQGWGSCVVNEHICGDEQPKVWVVGFLNEAPQTNPRKALWLFQFISMSDSSVLYTELYFCSLLPLIKWRSEVKIAFGFYSFARRAQPPNSCLSHLNWIFHVLPGRFYGCGLAILLQSSWDHPASVISSYVFLNL